MERVFYISFIHRPPKPKADKSGDVDGIEHVVR
jgi:hypothetical protein